ncbi:MAG: tetratricopeptide repeat protein, partial [Desulfobacteraceae bacterium]|nr:tetratricopeptide repeat protein [Desulfobacteraceae bacterium]
MILIGACLLLQALCPESLHAASGVRKPVEFPSLGALQKTLDYQQAIEGYTKTIQQKPKDPIAYYNRAMVYSALGMHDKAVADFNWAISLRPGALQPYLGKLGALYGAGKY